MDNVPAIQFLSEPEQIKTPWGHAGLGEIVYLRTYARDLIELERRERWPETIERTISGIRKINARLTPSEEDLLRGHMMALRGTVSGRALWQLDTPLVASAGMDSLVNCLAGETEVVTSEGIQAIRDLAGTSSTLMTDFGRWVEAPVMSFGEQGLLAIRLRRGEAAKTIRATAGHRWFVLGPSATGSWRTEKTTQELLPGDALVAVVAQDAADAAAPANWIVEGVEDLSVSEEVFCAVVPETHSFALADNILTGNCWFLTITKPADFRWIMDRLMVGGGVGFSVERSNIYKFPKVKHTEITHERAADTDFIVPDTRRGWSELVERVVDAHFAGKSFSYSTILVRSAGAPLKSFGGTASGPNALIEGIDEICKLMCARAGKSLRSIDVLDIANIIGQVVVAGSARRSAQIALGDPDDALFVRAKRWANGTVPSWRANSNNTIVVDHFDEIEDQAAFWRNFDGGSEPYGLFNRKLARTMGRSGERRGDPTVEGTNPCFSADTRILTDEGWRSFSELSGLTPTIIQDRRIQGRLDRAGIETWEVDPSLTGVVENRAHSARITARQQQLYRVTTADGRTVRATDNHHFATERGMTMLRDLHVGDELMVGMPEAYAPDRTSHDWTVGYLVGLVASDGYINSSGASISVWDTHGIIDAETPRIEGLIDRVLDTAIVREPELALSSASRPIHGRPRFRNVSPTEGGPAPRDVRSRIGDLMAARGWSKTDLAWLHYESRDLKAGFISGMMYGDGSVQDSHGSRTWRLSQSNRALLADLQLILQELGVRASVLPRRAERNVLMPDGHGGRQTHFARATFELIISGAVQCERAAVVLDIPPHHQQRWETLGARNTRPAYSDPDTTRIISIEPDAIEDVWCLAEDNRRTLIAEGLTARRCAEAMLADRESCNLATIWLPNIESLEQFKEVSRLLYKVQKATALLPHPDAQTQAIVHKNLRLGQNVTGILEATDEQRSWLSPGYEALRAFDKEWSAELGVPESVRLTVIQPGGTLSLLAGVTSGIHGAYAKHYIRRVRFGYSDPLVEICRQRGYPVVPEMGIDGKVDHTRWVVEFPCEAREGAYLASEMTAIDQLNWLTWAQKNWADQAVSITVTYKDEEMPAIRQWLTEHYQDEVKSVSFLRYSDHGFALAPYEPITKEEFDRRVAKVHLDTQATLHGVSTLDDDDCVGGACPVR